MNDDLISRQVIEQGIDRLGVEYKRTSDDFALRHIERDNCCCSICHGIGARWGFAYVTRNYQSPRTNKICKTLQEHKHSFWICPRCLEYMKESTGLSIEGRKEERAMI